ncbi:MAG: hypothetical protein QOH81_1453 [Sphingomonadales bacterium]|jgi:hypothetical protein|nr:hypothetical protein [Sphingomonadales bacterium]
MAKYDGLARFLVEVEDDSVTLKFDKVSELVPGGLPASAYDYRPWWANRYDGQGSQNQGWQSVGWETSDVDMQRGVVTFKRSVKRRSDFKDSPYVKPLTIADAKAGLAAHFGVTQDNIEIVVRG